MSKTALLTGATGITGSAILEALLSSPAYTKIHSISRSQPRAPHPKLNHATLDLQSSSSEMAKSLKESGVSSPIDVVFLNAYLARDDESDAADVNSSMLQNFLDALDEINVLSGVKRIILTCGLKQYGVHLGLTKQPMIESDPILTGDSWPRNFYYEQQEVLIKTATRKDLQFTWTVTLPQDIIGFAKGNFMNEATAIALYSLVSSRLNPNNELPFPGSKKNYLAFNCWTSADLHAKFCLWAVDTEGAKDQVFNVVNGDTESWMNLWPRVAGQFGGRVPGDMFGESQSENTTSGKTEEHSYTYGDFASTGPTKLHDPPPIILHAEKLGMKHLAEQPSTVYQMIDTAKWAERPDVTKAWEQVRDEYGLDQHAWEKATWGFLTFVLGREVSCVVSMSKARKLGWTGYEDTWESFENAFRKLEEAKILPPSEKLRR